MTFPRLPGNSELKPIHSNDLLRPVLSTNPAWSSAVEQLLALQQQAQTKPTRTGLPVDFLAADIAAALRAGEPIPDDLARRGADLLREAEGRQIAVAAVAAVEAQLVAAMDTAVRGRGDALLAHLNARLSEVTGAVRVMAAAPGGLGALRSAEAAVDAGRVEDYQRLRSFESLNRGIRQTQRFVLDRVCGVTPEWAEAVVVANIVEVFPNWAPWRSHGYLVRRIGGQSVPIEAPWPTGTGQRSQIDPDGVEMLTWAAEAGARLWVPTVAQLEEQGQALAARLAYREDTGGDLVDPGALLTGRRPVPASIRARSRAGVNA